MFKQPAPTLDCGETTNKQNKQNFAEFGRTSTRRNWSALKHHGARNRRRRNERKTKVTRSLKQ